MSDDKPTHLDLFSGIGGFAIAAQEAGFETIAFCESDARCRSFLEKTWGKPVEPDVRKLDGHKYRGISLLTGGPPCQPASRAGKQGGDQDDRWLWKDALRVLDEAKPDCVVFENPPGILDVGIDGILSEMGRCGYEVQPFDIPACAVDSPQLRHRIWIVGFMDDANKRQRRKGKQVCAGRQSVAVSDEICAVADTSRNGERRIRETTGADCERVGKSSESNSGNLANTTEPGRERPDTERGENGCRSECVESIMADSKRQRRKWRSAVTTETEGRQSLGSIAGLHSEWSESGWIACADNKLRRAPYNLIGLANGLSDGIYFPLAETHRSILAALGNSIVPQVAYEILVTAKRIIDAKVH